MPAPPERLSDYARLAVRVGLNLQPGQILGINALLEHAPLARAVAREAYAAGARFVDVLYGDQRVRRAHIAGAGEDALAWSPPWLVKRLEDFGERGDALLAFSGNPEPEVFAGLDGARVGRARMREVSEASLRLSDGLCNWSIVAFPNEGWARTVFGEPDVERLWDAVATAARLDEPDPVQAWRDHIEQLRQRAASLDERGFASLRFVGPGTDLRVGLPKGHRWLTGAEETVDGIPHIVNVPTEEVFTTPDRRLTEGTVRSTFPLSLGGTIVRGLEVRFEAGKAVEVRAESGADAVREEMATDEGSSYLGEVALVDGDSRVRKTGVVFYDTLFDENAACHIAWGQGIKGALDGGEELSDDELAARGYNDSVVHTDFMVGGPEVDVLGVEHSGAEVPVISDDVWVLS
jgi:aminopeptidase